MCDDALRMVMTAMRMISGGMMTRYPPLFSRELSNLCFICVLSVCNSYGYAGGAMCFVGMSRDVGNSSQV